MKLKHVFHFQSFISAEISLWPLTVNNQLRVVIDLQSEPRDLAAATPRPNSHGNYLIIKPLSFYFSTIYEILI